MENEVFKTDEPSEIAIEAKPAQSENTSRKVGPILSNNIDDTFVSIPPEVLSKNVNKLSDFKKIPDIIKLSSDEIRIHNEVKTRAKPKISTRNSSDFSERLARISKQTKSINLDLDLN